MVISLNWSIDNLVLNLFALNKKIFSYNGIGYEIIIIQIPYIHFKNKSNITE